jgi:hypothetical protein
MGAHHFTRGTHMNTTPSRRAAAAAVTAVLALSACDSLSSGDDYLDQSPNSMAKTAFADTRKATSMRITGSTEDTGDLGFIRMDIRLDDTSCYGRIKSEDGDLQIIKNPEGTWFQADEHFWRAHAPSFQVADKVAAWGGSWVAVKKDEDFLELCDLDSLLREFKLDKRDKRDKRGTLVVGEVETIGGGDAVPLTGRADKEEWTVWAAVEAPHHVVKMAPADDHGLPDALFFDYDVHVLAETPDKKDIITIPGI